MTPIDDELRAALHGRAHFLAPAPDPLAGIERRAKRIQRNRIGAAVAGSALAVAAIAVAVPALQSATTTTGPRPPAVASAEPTLVPAPVSYALDPTDPWAYRGADLELLGPGTLDTVERELGIRYGTNDVELTPLFGQVWEPSQKFELVFVATVAGEHRWGISETPNEAGPEFLWDEPLADGLDSLAAALPGDEVARLLVVAAPEATAFAYGPDAASEYAPMAELAEGVATLALEGDPADDRYRVTWPSSESDTVSAERLAPDLPAVEQPTGEQPTGEPVTALDPDDPWEVRGDRSLVTDGQLQALGEDWATREGVPASSVEVTPLYVQRNEVDAGIEVVYLVRSGSGPWIWGVSSLGEGGWWWYAENELAPGTSALAASLPGDEGLERLLVVGAPSLSGGMYAADGSDFSPMTDVAPGVFVTPISPGDPDDRFLVLDGDGDLDDPVAEGTAPDFQNAG